MRDSRFSTVLLALLAAGVWTLILMEVDLANFTASAEAASVPVSGSVVQSSAKPGSGEGPVRAPAATYPLRWRLPWATEVSSGTTHCGTAIAIVRNGW